MSKKTKIIIFGVLAIIFFSTWYKTLKIIPNHNRDKQPESILIYEDDNKDKESGFYICINPSNNYNYHENITVYIYYNGKMVDCFNTYVNNDGKALNEDFFQVEYYDDYIKLNILDCDKKITGIFRGYIDESYHQRLPDKDGK